MTGRTADTAEVDTGTAAGTRWLDEGQQQTWRAYIMGTQLLLDRLDRDLRAEFGISMTEYEILVRLSESPGRRMRMALLADALCHSRSRVTHTVARMEKARPAEPVSAAMDDGRGVEAVMTDEGFALLETAAHTHVEGVRRNLVDLADPDGLRGARPGHEPGQRPAAGRHAGRRRHPLTDPGPLSRGSAGGA